MSSPLPMTNQREHPEKRRRKKVWIKYLIHVTATISIKRGCISASTRKALQSTYRHNERSTIACGRQVHLPWKTSPSVVHINDEVNAMIAKASEAFGRLRRNIWDRR